MSLLNRTVKSLVLLICFVGGVTFQSFAQESRQPYFITSYTTAQGLSGNLVGAITEDEEGFLWVGTTAGLNRYNGYDFTVYKSDVYDSTSLTSNSIIGLLTDRTGKLWIASSGICTFDKKHNRFHAVPVLLENGTLEKKVECLFVYEDSRRNIWAGTNGLGLLKFNAAAGYFQPLTKVAALPASQRSLLPTSVSSMSEDRDGTLWVASYTHLYRLNAALNELTVVRNMIAEPSGARPFQALKVFPHGSDPNLLWLTSWGSGLVLFDKRTQSFTAYQFESHLPSNVSNIVFSFLRMEKNVIWLGTNIGIIPFRESEKKFDAVISDDFNDKSSVRSLIRSIYKAKNGMVWTGSESGLSSIDPDKQFFLRNRVLPYNHSFYHIDQTLNKLYATVVYNNRSVLVYDLKSKERRSIPIPGADENRAEPFLITADSEGLMWIGTTKGIYTFDPSTLRIKKYDLQKDLQLSGAEPYVHDIATDKEGNVWFLTSPYDLLKYSRSHHTLSRITPGSKVQDNTFEGAFRFTFKDDETLCLLSARKGVIQLNTQTLQATVVDPVVNNNRVFSSGTDIASDTHHNIWVTTGSSGLICVDESGTVRHYNKDIQGNLIDEQSNLTVDRQGNVWLTSTKGLYRFDTRARQFTLYGNDQGLPDLSQDTKLYLQSDGSVSFNIRQGIFRFTPETVPSSEEQLQVHLGGFAINGKPSPLSRSIDQTQHLTLTHEQNNLTFEYAAINFRNPHATLYTYKLEGAQTDWSAPTSNRLLHFYKLKPGEYALKIRAAVLNFTDATPVKTIRITIVPAWYQTSLFFWLSGIAVVLALAFTIRYFITMRFRQQIIFMEHQGQLEQMRARISRDIHDEIGAGLTKIKLLGRALGKKLQSEDSITQLSKKINDSSDELIQNLGEIVWTINPENDSLENMVAYMRFYLLKTFEGAPETELQLEFPEPESIPKGVMVIPDVKRNLLLILKESVNNVQKHASATQVKVKLKVSLEEVLLEIQDNGQGFVPDLVHPNGNGLKNMKKRADAVNGILTVYTAAKQGTTIRLSVSIRNT